MNRVQKYEKKCNDGNAGAETCTGTTGEREGGIRKKTLCVIEKDKGVDWETWGVFLCFAWRKRRFSHRETYVFAGRNVRFPKAKRRKWKGE